MITEPAMIHGIQSAGFLPPPADGRALRLAGAAYLVRAGSARCFVAEDLSARARLTRSRSLWPPPPPRASRAAAGAAGGVQSPCTRRRSVSSDA